MPKRARKNHVTRGGGQVGFQKVDLSSLGDDTVLEESDFDTTADYAHQDGKPCIDPITHQPIPKSHTVVINKGSSFVAYNVDSLHSWFERKGASKTYPHNNIQVPENIIQAVKRRYMAANGISDEEEGRITLIPKKMFLQLNKDPGINVNNPEDHHPPLYRYEYAVYDLMVPEGVTISEEDLRLGMNEAISVKLKDYEKMYTIQFQNKNYLAFYSPETIDREIREWPIGKKYKFDDFMLFGVHGDSTHLDRNSTNFRLLIRNRIKDNQMASMTAGASKVRINWIGITASSLKALAKDLGVPRRRGETRAALLSRVQSKHYTKRR